MLFILFFFASIVNFGSAHPINNPFAAWTRWNVENINIFSHAIKSMISPASLPITTQESIVGYCFDDIAGTIPDDITELVSIMNSPNHYREHGIELPKGLLLYGPPGTGKTSLAKAIAGETNAAFFAKSASDFIELYIGNGPKQVRELFASARQALQSGEYTKAIIFIDEIDAIGGTRKAMHNNGDREYNNTLNELLHQMDGFLPQAPIVVIGATNRVEELDKALLRPGRFDKLVEIPLPNSTSRQAIIELYAKKLRLNISDRLFTALAKKTVGYNGAELKNLIQEAQLCALKEGAPEITESHFAIALKKTLDQKKIRS